MKILHVLESLGAGTLTSCSQICNLMIKSGHEVHLIYSPLREETPLNWEEYFDRNVIFHRVDMTRGISLINDFRSFLSLRGKFLSINPDVIHLHCAKAGFLGRFAILFSNSSAKVFYSPRGYSFLQMDVGRVSSFLYYVLEKIAVILGGTTVACSYSEFEESKKVGGSSLLVENAIDSQKIPVKEWAGAKSVVKIGTVGRICAQKNPLLFAKLAAQFSDRADVAFFWIGGGDKVLESKLRSSGVDVLGWLDREKALSHLSDLDIYLQTSLWEGMPLSVIEASLSGVPAVVTDVIGNRDVVEHGVTGFVGNGFSQLSQHLLGLVDSYELRMSMGKKSRSLGLDRFGMNRLLKDINSLYFSNEFPSVMSPLKLPD